MRAVPSTDIASRQQRRGFWLRTLHHWHWISSALCLAGMLLFAVTGVTLNHAGSIESEPVTTTATAQLPASLARLLARGGDGNRPLPPQVAAWLEEELSVSIGEKPAEWSVDEAYLPLPRPGGDGWLSIDRATGAVEHEATTRGAIAYLNDLHKGRNAGTAWKWFIDVFAIACLVFCVTGLFLLQLHARQRPATWPYVGLGLLVPVVLALIFIH